MEFETIREVAKRLGVTERAVQKWASSGKLPGAEKVGRDWRIPKGISSPSQAAAFSPTDSDASDKPFRMALPLLSGNFEPGKAMEFINSIEDEDDRNIAMGEYYYYSGQSQKASAYFEPYLYSHDPALRYSAEINSIFVNIALGRTHLAKFAFNGIIQQFTEGFQSIAPVAVHAIGIMTMHGLSALLHAPVPEAPPLEEYLNLLPRGLKLWGCYILAYREYQKKNYERALAIIDICLIIAPAEFPIPRIYCELVAIISLLALMRSEEAKARFEKLWVLAGADGFVEIISEHYSELQGIIGASFKESDPETYRRIVESVKNFGANWINLHNLVSKHNIADNLSVTEFNVAMLYNRGWSAQEISSHMKLSENTVRGYIKSIYTKLGISDKKALSQFMLK